MRSDRIFIVGILFLLVPGLLFGVYREAVGWNALEAELGEEAPLGRGIKVSLIESAPFGGNYQPDTGNFEFSGKTFSMKSGDAGVSSHATVVGQLFFGTHSSMARAIDVIDVYDADDWLLAGPLRTAKDALPAVETSRIQNHSWVGNFTDDHAFNIEAVRRLDFAIGRDRFVAVAALSNDTGNVRSLLAHSYNAITVGRPNGNHSRGGTWFDEAGRVRPDIIAPGGFFTSYSAPVVSSAVAVLLEEADRNAGLANARHNPEVIKSILMAGATKEPFPGWARSDDQPLDEVFGAGQLNIYNSYRILAGGEHGTGVGVRPAAGWHFGTVSGESKEYYFSFDEEQETFTANLAWNRLLNLNGGTNFLDAEVLLARLELRLFEANGVELGAPIQGSLDLVNNSQHLYIEGLAAGDYVLVVRCRDDSITDDGAYGLAWEAVAVSAEPPTHFEHWRNHFFSDDDLQDPAISGQGADPDRDAISNLLEYALGGDPGQADREILPVVRTVDPGGGEHLAVTFTRLSALEDIIYRVDVSGDLMNWTEGGAVLVESIDEGEGRFRDTYRDVEPPDAADSRFIRLSVSLQEP